MHDLLLVTDKEAGQIIDNRTRLTFLHLLSLLGRDRKTEGEREREGGGGGGKRERDREGE